jgi:TonB-linked SusC/RagA family outer membrane protein
MKILLHPAVGIEAWPFYWLSNRGARFLMKVSFFISLLLAASLQLTALNTNGQSIDNIQVTLGFKDARLSDILRVIQNETGISFVFTPDQIKHHNNISIPENKRTVRATLDLVLEGTPLTFKEVKNKTVVIFKRNTQASFDPAPEALDTIFPIQDIKVTGTVTDAKTNEPIPGVSIQVKGSDSGTTTDATGNYTLSADEAATLVFTSVGYSILEQPIASRSAINVQMVEDVEKLDEVVIKANYYDVNDRDNVGSISTVGADVIRRQPISNPLQAMQGRVPGMYVSQTTGIPGSNFQVRIRGTNSINNGNNPLYIIDGIPFRSESLSDDNTSGALYGFGQGVSPLNSINPNDIESISVLKDAEATAIYGSRGANGVVLITTKRGRAGKVTVSADIRSGISFVTHYVDLLKTERYLDMRYEAVANDGDDFPSAEEYDINGTWDQSRYTNWQKKLLGGTANNTTVNASVSGGNNETQFLFSVGHDRQTTVMPGDNSARKFSTHFSINHTSPDKKFFTHLTTSYTLNNTDLLSADLTQQALSLAPNAPKLYDEDGNLNWENSTWKNPLSNLLGRFNANTSNILTNAEVGYQVIKELTVKANLGINDIRNEETNTDPSNKYVPFLGYTPASSKLTMGRGTNRSWIVEPQINYERQLGKGKLLALAGGTYQYQLTENSREVYTGFASNALINDPQSASTSSLETYAYTQYRYAALYGRFNFTWDEKYILTLTGRRDGSSRFGPGRQFANLGAIGLGWIFSNENFIKTSLPFISLGKIRASYGITGNDQIGDYRFLDTYRSAGVAYQGVNGLVPVQLYNPNYGWETNKKLEGAIDLGFLEDRIRLTASFYRNRSANQLIDYRLAGTSGFGTVLKNSPATVQNSGLEFELTTNNVSTASFQWTSSFNITVPKNKLLSFPNIESSSYYTLFEVGKPLAIQKRFHYLGIDPATGIYRFTDVNNDGQFTIEDKQSVINLGQEYYGGLNNSFSYKGIQLDIFIQFVKQNNFRYSPAGYPGQAMQNQPDYVFNDRWLTPSDGATRQLFFRNNLAAAKAYQNFSQSDEAVTDASFIRLKNISLSYQLPKKIFKTVDSRLYLQAQNLFTITNYYGMDPESGANRMPPLTTIVLGAQLSL